LLLWRLNVRRLLNLRLAALAVTLGSLAGCHRGPQPLELRGPAMGTTYSVIVTRAPNDVRAGDIQAQVSAALADADRHLSGWNDASEIVRFNASRASGWQPVSRTLFDVVAQARAVSEASGGAFDITVAPLVRAWGFGAGAGDDPPEPPAAERQRLLARVGFGRLELREDPPALRKTVPDLSLDLDGIAPGWAVDRIAARLEALGVRDYLVELGGEVRGRGRSPGARPWRIAVETPLAGARRPEAVIEIDGAGVSTSGDYREFREVDGRRVSHTIDPRSGEPVGHGLAAVTVVCGSAAEADAWATALMVLGRAEGLALAERLGLAALFIERGAQPGEFVESQTPQFARLRLPDAARL
jgi:thiamine biosynthesis lipoprotein